MRPSRDTLFALALVGLLALITVAAGVQQTRTQAPPALASFSSAPNGALALKTWLDEIGFTIAQDVTSAYRPPAAADFVLVLEPRFAFQPNELSVVDHWVEAGGTLVLAGSSPAAILAMQHYQFSLGLLLSDEDHLTLETPWFAPPFPDATLAVKTDAYLIPARNDFITHLSSNAGPVLVSFRKGLGQVFLCATAYPFTNQGLKDADPPAILSNLFSFDMQKGQLFVWFDEWHHGVGVRDDAIVGPVEWLRRTPAGQSLLYVAALLLVALVLQGRRFGRPTPLPKELNRRRPLEHITALANLSRLAGHRREILRHFHRQLKRQLGSRYRLDPSLPDGEWVLQLNRMRPELDSAALLGLLERLSQPSVSESELVKLAREASDWLGRPKDRPL
jgi:hypothetical protein